jgi:hypothetical protein
VNYVGDGPFRGMLELKIPRRGTAAFLNHSLTIASGATSPNPSKSEIVELLGLSSTQASASPAPSVRRFGYVFNTSVSDQEFVVTVPPIEINGSRYEVEPIRFSLRQVRIVCEIVVCLVD